MSESLSNSSSYDSEYCSSYSSSDESYEENTEENTEESTEDTIEENTEENVSPDYIRILLPNLVTILTLFSASIIIYRFAPNETIKLMNYLQNNLETIENITKEKLNQYI